MRLFFQTFPKPLRQHPILKKIIHFAIFKDLVEKLFAPLLFSPFKKIDVIGFHFQLSSKRRSFRYH
jgi:hypothetical protein